MKAATIIFSPNGGISLIESFALVCMFAHTNLITYESLYSSSYLLNEYLLYDKLWGPSQRVVTLFRQELIHILTLTFFSGKSIYKNFYNKTYILPKIWGENIKPGRSNGPSNLPPHIEVASPPYAIYQHP